MSLAERTGTDRIRRERIIAASCSPVAYGRPCARPSWRFPDGDLKKEPSINPTVQHVVADRAPSDPPAAPAITLVEVSRLFSDELLIEIEGIAAA